MLNKKYFKSNLFVILIAIFFVAGSIYFFSKDVKAQTTNPTLSGYAWSSNIGWISFTPSTNGNNQITIDSSGYLKGADGVSPGYAWSSSIGWIKFGGLSNFPPGAGTTGDNAKYNFSTGAITGWARALSADGNGWDGWISLSGTNYGITSGTPSSGGAPLSGYAWGSDVVGWIDFSKVSVQNLTAVPVVTSTFVLSVSGSSCLSSGVTLSWSSVSGAQTYNIYRSDLTTNSLYSIIKTGIIQNSFSDSGSFNPGDIYSYKISATNSSGDSSSSASVQSSPCGSCQNGAINKGCNICDSNHYFTNGYCAIKSSSSVDISSFEVIPRTIVRGGDCKLSWTLTPPSPDASSTCSLYRGNYSSPIYTSPQPAVNMSATSPYPDKGTDNKGIQNETIYKLSCGETDSSGNLVSSSVVNKYATCNINQTVKEVNQ